MHGSPIICFVVLIFWINDACNTLCFGKYLMMSDKTRCKLVDTFEGQNPTWNIYGWNCPGGDSHTKKVVIFLITTDFVTFWWYLYVSVRPKKLWEISRGIDATNLDLRHDLGGYYKVNNLRSKKIDKNTGYYWRPSNNPWGHALGLNWLHRSHEKYPIIFLVLRIQTNITRRSRSQCWWGK